MLDKLYFHSTNLVLGNSKDGISLKGFADWFGEQIKYVLFIVLLSLMVYAFVKRAWVFAVGMFFGLSIIAFLVANPDALSNFGTWLAGLLNLKGGG